MKKIYFIIPVLFIQAFVFATGLKPEKQATVFNHLTEVNKEWKSLPDFVPDETIQFESDLDRIQFHLFAVENLLRNKSISGLNSAQIKNRLQTLDILHQYAAQKIFPVNTFHQERRPYFIDIYGTHCAVGYLVKATGYGNVSLDISKGQNYAYVKDIQSQELISWSQKFGFSLDELALIQPAYAPATQYQQVQGGTNGTVHVLNQSQDAQNTLLIGGEFSQLNNAPCLNIGYYANNQLSCYGSGIAGKVIGVYKNIDDVIAAGKLLSNGNTYPLAFFNGTNWSFESIPNRTNAEATAFFVEYNSVEIAINHPTDAGKQEIWQRSANANTWSLKAVVNGKVYSILKSGYQHVYAGVFNTVTIIENEDAEIYNTKNVLIRNLADEGWETVNSHVSDTIFTAFASGEALYLGGSASTPQGVCISRYLNESIQPLLNLADLGTTYGCIKDLEIFNNQDLIAAGNFNLMDMMYFGKHILKINLASNTVTPLSNLNDAVNAIANINGVLYFGGEFTASINNSTPLNHLIKMTSPLAVEELEDNHSIQIFPNPSEGKIYFSDISQVKSISVFDLQGKTWLKNTSGITEIDGSHLPNGVYMIQIEGENKNIQTKKWVKI